MNMINYEDAVEAALIDGLKAKFNIENNATLIKYLFSRFAILHGADNISDASQFMNFLLQELCILYTDPDGGNKTIEFHYNDLIVMVENGFAACNSLLNIFDSIEGEFLNSTFVNNHGDVITPNAYIKSLVSDIQTQSRQRLKPYRKSHYSNELQTLFKLQILNEKFCIKTPVEAPLISAFTQNNSRISIDTLYGRYLHAENFDTTNVHSVTEAQVRDYLYIHLDLIEDGLRPMMKEFPTKEGRVDIVAKDKDDNLVVIEVKIENDKRLIWQCMYYPDEVQKRLGLYGENKKVRMITVAPEYPEFIVKPLHKLGYVESYTYTIKAFNNTIEDICVELFQNKHGGENGSSFDSEIKSKLDDLINSFVYAKKTLCENDACCMDSKSLDDVALELVKMAHQTGRDM